VVLLLAEVFEDVRERGARPAPVRVLVDRLPLGGADLFEEVEHAAPLLIRPGRGVLEVDAGHHRDVEAGAAVAGVGVEPLGVAHRAPRLMGERLVGVAAVETPSAPRHVPRPETDLDAGGGGGADPAPVVRLAGTRDGRREAEGQRGVAVPLTAEGARTK